MKRFFSLMLAAFLLTGCAAGSASLTGNIKPAPMDATRSPVPIGPDSAAPVAAFSYPLFRECMKGGKENPVISPLSAYLCLAMLQNGTSGGTEKEFAAVLGLDTLLLNHTAHALMTRLSAASGDTVLKLANSCWVDDGSMQISDAFLQAIVDYYGAEAFTADLSSDRARQAVNDWVNARTAGMIPSLRETNYPESTRLALINTLYFKATWRTRFWPDNTYEGDFTPASGKVVRIPFMHMNHVHFDYAQSGNMDGVILPYNDDSTVFIALRPQNGMSARALAAALSAETLNLFLKSAKNTYIDLTIPKFTAEFSIEMNDALKAMGLRRVFDPSTADLGRLGISAGDALWLDTVQQKVKLIVDERGTEAAAVTEAAATGSAFMQEQPLDFSLDRPFVYAVVDAVSGVPLFMGVLDDPSK